MTTEYNTDALKYIRTTGNTAFSQLAAVTRVAEKYASDQPTHPNIIWNEHDNYSSLYYNNGRISIDGIARFALILEDEAWQLLKDKVLLGANIPCLHDPIDPNATNHPDMMSSMRMGYAFYVDPRNRILSEKSTTGYIIRHILSTPDLKLKFFGADGRTPNATAFEEWMKDVAALVLKILTLVHTTAGAPTRGTEICGATVVNNQKSGLRNVFFTYGRIMLTQFYHKTAGIHGDRYLARFLPKPLSRLVVIMLCVVRPVERYATRIIHANNPEMCDQQLAAYNLYLFVCQGKVATSEQLSRLLARKTNEVLGVSVSLLPLRHIIVAFMSTRLQHFININAFDEMPDYDIPAELARGRPAVTDTASSLLFHHQGSHTIRVANRTYAFSQLDFAFLGRDNLLNFFLCSLEHQQMIGCDLSELDKQSLRQQKPQVINLRESVVDIGCIPVKRHISSVAPAAPIIEGETDVVVRKRRLHITVDDFEHVNCELDMNILFKLREFYGDLTASFKSVDQARAMAMVLKRESDVLAVLATGQGKSLLFFLAAFIEKQQGRTTVVVSPLVALMADMKARCNMHGLTYDTWRDARSTLTRVDILFVAVEHCSNIDLLCHLRALSQHGDRLARIVFDEAHLAITWNDWRPEMHNLHTLRTQRVPILLLTATLPPKLEQELKIAFGSNFTTVRQASTTRPELQYKVTKKEKTSEMREELFSAIEALITDNNGHAAIIIFFLETRTAERFQEEIQETRSSTQVLVYHGQMTPEARTANQTAFMRETDGVMIMCCTSAFAMGVDKADINAVIHYGICDSIMEYVQGAGRAKRNPDAFIAPGQCILLTSDEQMEDLRQFRLRGQHGKAKISKEQQLDEMIHYVNTTKCRRYAIHSVLDPVGVSCAMSNDYIKCDNCYQAVMTTPEAFTFEDNASISSSNSNNSSSSSDSSVIIVNNPYSSSSSNNNRYNSSSINNNSNRNNSPFNSSSINNSNRNNNNRYSSSSNSNNNSSSNSNNSSSNINNNNSSSINNNNSSSSNYNQHNTTNNSSRNIQPAIIASASSNQQSNYNGQQAMLAMKDYRDWINGRCATCTLSTIANEDQYRNNNMHEQKHCYGSKCYKCWYQTHLIRDCQFYQQIYGNKQDICMICYMYKAPRYEINVHKYNSPCVDAARGRVIPACLWLLMQANVNTACKRWMEAQFHSRNISSYEAFINFLTTTDGRDGYGTSLMNYYIVIWKLMEFMQQNNFTKTPAQLTMADI